MKQYFLVAIISFFWSCCPRPQKQVIKNIKLTENLSLIKTYRSLNKALKNPENVIILDLSGQDLTSIPSSISKLKNLEILDLGDRPKNLLFSAPRLRFHYCKVGGGLRHFDRRQGKYFNRNNITELPIEIFNLKNLKVIRLTGNEIPEKTTSKLKKQGIKIF